MMFFQCKELELLEGVNRARRINYRGRSQAYRVSSEQSAAQDL